jgi:hypothetical protein
MRWIVEPRQKTPHGAGFFGAHGVVVGSAAGSVGAMKCFISGGMAPLPDAGVVDVPGLR